MTALYEAWDSCVLVTQVSQRRVKKKVHQVSARKMWWVTTVNTYVKFALPVTSALIVFWWWFWWRSVLGRDLEENIRALWMVGGDFQFQNTSVSPITPQKTSTGVQLWFFSFILIFSRCAVVAVSLFTNQQEEISLNASNSGVEMLVGQTLGEFWSLDNCFYCDFFSICLLLKCIYVVILFCAGISFVAEY